MTRAPSAPRSRRPDRVQGPKVLEVLRDLVEAPIDNLGFCKCTITRLAGVPAVVSRTGWSGGLGCDAF
jgi:glycine cleavage system aminomethyltransferase T